MDKLSWRFFSRRGPRFYGVCAFFLKGRIILAPGGDFIPVKKSPGRITPELHAGLENIVIFSKISKYRKHQKYHDIFDTFDIFQKMEISSKLYNNGCNVVLVGLPQRELDRVQSVVNAAARLSADARKYECTTT